MNAAASRSARRAYINMLRTKQKILLSIFFLAVLFPVILIAISNTTNGTWRSWPRELGSFAGLLGLSLMILASVPINRLPPVTKAFNQDVVYTFHHKYTTAGFFFSAFHLATLWINNPGIGRYLNVFKNYPFYMKSAVFTLVIAGLMVCFAHFRKEFHIDYDVWKFFHSIFAIAVVVFGLIHVFGVNYYTALPWIRWYYIIITAFSGFSILWLRIVSPVRQLGKPYRIIEVNVMNNDATEIVLEFAGKPDQRPIPYHSGQVAWISVRQSPFSFSKHPFSITSDDTNQNRLSFAIRDLGNFTSTVKDLNVGETVYVEGWFGIFDPYKLGNEGIVMIANGIGIAPVMGMLRSLASRKDKRRFVVFFGSRDRESILFYDELNEISKVLNLDVIHILEQTDDPAFEKGAITEEVLRSHFPKSKDAFDVFVCGPLPMVTIVNKSLERMGIDKKNRWPEFYEMA